ncbi:MAG: 50S ribosomal protein L18 [Phycisphaerae bacterium]
MSSIKTKTVRRIRRKRRIRKSVFGTPECPRLTVFRSLKYIYAQLVDDTAGRTLVSASSRTQEQGTAAGGGNRTAAAQVGKLLGEQAVAKGIQQAAFDRNGYRFHGRVKALADAAREAGLKI